MIVGTDFYRAVLQKIGAPTSGNLLNLCNIWQTYEGGNAQWNPWNTTEGWAGATNYNDVGVKNYPDQPSGEGATAATLVNGHYPDVVSAFQHDLPIDNWGNNQAILDQINVWGTHGFAAYLKSIAVPIIPKEPDMVVLVSTTGGAYVVSGSSIVPENDPTTLANLIAGGIPQIGVEPNLINELLAQAPPYGVKPAQ